MSLIEREMKSFRSHPLRSTLLWVCLIALAVSIFWLMGAGPDRVAYTLFGASEPSSLEIAAAYCLPLLPLPAMIVTIWFTFDPVDGQRILDDIEKDGTKPTLGVIFDRALNKRDGERRD